MSPEGPDVRDSMVIDAGSIVVTMKSSGVSPCVIGATITLAPVPPGTPDLGVSWVCSTTAVWAADLRLIDRRPVPRGHRARRRNEGVPVFARRRGAVAR
jgi:hypothetical protein